MTALPVTTLGLVLLVASIVAMISRRLELPYSIGLVGAGIVLALLPIDVKLPLSRDLIFDVFLPPLVFEAALQLRWRFFRRNLPVTLLLAFPGVVVACFVVGAGMHYGAGWSWMGALLFGALLSATDPVSVIAMFKELGVRPRLSLLVESESILNDGSAAVLFGLLVTIGAGSAAPTVLSVGVSLVWTVLGGVIVGGAVAGAALLLAGRTEDHLVENTLTAIAAYGSFLTAEHFGMSGVLASMTAGLVVGNVGLNGPITETSRPHVLQLWEFGAFIANSIVFVLIGANEAHVHVLDYLLPTLVAIPLMLCGRALAVYPLCGLLARTSIRVAYRYQHVLFWGGLRGALGLALALALPAWVPEREAVVTVAFAAVAFSIFCQGLTMPWLTHRLDVLAESDTSPRGDLPIGAERT